MSIRAKIILGFTITLLASLVIGGYSVFTVNKITRMTEEHNDLAAARREVYNVLNAHYLWRQGLIVAVFGDSDFSGSLDPDTCALGQWLDDPEQQRMVNDSVRELLTVLEQPHDLIHTQAAETVQLLKEGRRDEAIAQYTNDIAPNAEKSIELLTQIAEQYSIMMESNSVSIHEFQIMALYIIIALIAAVTVIAVMLAVLIIKSVLKPIRRLAEVSEDIAKGRLNVNIDTAAKDETGMLARSFDNVRTVVDRLILDLEELGKKELEGEIDARIDASKYEGAYKEVAQVINQLIDSKNSDILRFLDFMKMFGKGDFDISLPPMPGKKVIMNEVSDTFKNAINAIHSEMAGMTKNASNGELSKTVDTASYSGKWAELVDDLNVLMQAMSAPIAEAAEVLGYVSRGDFGHKMQGNYKGEFLKIKDSINTTVTSIASYIGEISSVLTAISRNDLNQEITRGYVGSFSDIKNAMNNIIFTLNDIIGDIRAASDQVASESQMISQSSMVLASGSIEQTEAVEYLNTMILSINESTAQNAENAFKAESFSGDSKQKASQGNEYMKDMLESMEGIKTSSGKITNIIKVIEDIAFQTNLLALNAAVEAARAGEHGKGFAVVASEVRTLAGRSQVAAKETTALIDESISKVGEGMRIAEKTAAALMSIVGGVEQEAGIITDIASGSKKQSEAIAKVTESLSKITKVVQSNSSTSHETASASEELSGQAEAMRKLVGLFKLKSKLNPQGMM